jgi:hypothetical protein
VPTAAAADPASQPLAFAPAGGNDRWIILIMLGVVAGLLLRELLSALHVGQRLRRRYF